MKNIAEAAFAPPHKIYMAMTLKDGLNAIARTTYDVALIDLKLPDGWGIEVLRGLRENVPEVLCVVTTVLGDDQHIVAALSAGADGYILKEQPTETVVLQLSRLARNIPALSPPVARRIIEHFRRTGPVGAPESNLTVREKEVLALVSRGMRNGAVTDPVAVGKYGGHAYQVDLPKTRHLVPRRSLLARRSPRPDDAAEG